MANCVDNSVETVNNLLHIHRYLLLWKLYSSFPFGEIETFCHKMSKLGENNMLHLARNLNELNFSSLMNVYIEGNLEKAEEGLSLLQAEQDFYQYLHDDFFRAPGAVYCVWQEAGCYVSALRLEPYKDGWLLEALETAPEHRRKGFAEALIRQILQLPQYGKIYSHIHKKNTASLAVHEKCGFRRISESAVYISGSVNSRACTMCFEHSES